MAARREPGQGRGSATIGDLYRVPDHGKAELVDGEPIDQPKTKWARQLRS